jgi:hypothetical protein
VRRSRKALALKLAACTFAGAALTVAVAWIAFILWSPPQPTKHPPWGADPWPRKVPAGWPPQMDLVWKGRSSFVTQVHGQGLDAASKGHVLICTSAGWPVRALELQRFVTLTSVSERGALTFPIESQPSRLGSPGRGVVPVLPRAGGFALDTAFYGTIVFLLWSAPTVIRRRARKRRGRCPACGYDLRATPNTTCPECGFPSATGSTPSSGAPAQPGHSA